MHEASTIGAIVNIGRITVYATVKVKSKEHILSIYTTGTQRTFEIGTGVPLLTGPYDMGVLIAKQQYCMYKYDFQHLDEDWYIIHSN